MRKFLTFLILIVNFFASNAQLESAGQPLMTRKKMDTLYNILLEQKEDSGRIKMMIKLSRSAFQMGLFDSQVIYGQRALDLSQKNKNIQGETTAYGQIIWGYRQMGRFAEALQAAFKNLQLAEASKDTMIIIEALRHVTFTYINMKDYPMALSYARRTKSLVHSGVFKNEKESGYGAMHGYMNFMGAAFEGLNRMDSSYYYRNMAYKTAQQLQDNQALGLTSESLARYFMKRARYDSALLYYRLSIDYIKQAGFRFDLLADAHYGIANIFKHKNQTDSAIYYAKLSLYASNHMRRLAPQVEAATLLHTLYQDETSKDSAYKYLHWAATYKDSLFNQERIKQIENVKYKEALRLQQLEQERKVTQQRYITRIKMYSLIGGIVMMLVVAYFLYRNNQQKQKANIQLQKQKEETEQALKELKNTQAQLVQHEKMALLGELTSGIAHEIQNPLNFVNNFSEVSVELIDDIERAWESGDKEEVKIITQGVKDNLQMIVYHGKRAGSIVKSMLEHSRSIKGDKQLVNLNELVDKNMRIAYHTIISKDKTFAAKLETTFDASVDNITLVPQDISRVLLNLFNNAFYSIQEKKKALNGTYEPIVSVGTLQKDKVLEIWIKDNGKGISPKAMNKIFQPFFTTKPTGEGTGLGLSLTYDIIKAHGGDIKVESIEGEYAEFKVQLPS